MPFTVEQLLGDRGEPITAERDETVKKAFERMLEYDFSQLPVVDANRHPYGLVTSESILRAVNYFSVTPDKLSVMHAIKRVPTYRTDADLFEVLDGIRDAATVLIVESTGRLRGIVTSYDTTDYFHRRAEDLMLVEDVELTLRDYIEAIYRDSNGEVNQAQLNEAIVAITPSNDRAMFGRFKQAVQAYLNNEGGSVSQLNADRLNQVFRDHLHTLPQPRSAERLDLNDYIQLLRNIWAENYQSGFNLEWGVMEGLLNSVRQARNAVAHFREVTSEQRDQLRFCTELLAQYPPTFSISSAIAATADAERATPQVNIVSEDSEDIGTPDEPNLIDPISEEVEPNESRYAPLAIHLQRIPLKQDKIQLSFSAIEEIIGDQLPPSARQHRNWWANDAVSHTQSQQWLEVGWRVSGISMGEQRVIFSRINERQSDYIAFFNTLVDKLKQQTSLSITPKPTSGRHWQLLEVADSRGRLWLVFSFARRRQFRVEFYIDWGNVEKNKQVFEALQHQQPEIEAKVGAPLNWERLDTRRASRIAMYHPGAIIDSAESLETLQNWAINALERFYNGLIEPVMQLSTTD